MNQDEFAGQWHQIQRQARQWWGKLTDDELEHVNGSFDQFINLLQTKYSYSRTAAEDALNQRMAEQVANQKKFAIPIQ